MENPNYIFRVDWRSGLKIVPGVFLASTEDIALSYCLEFTAVRKYSLDPAWLFSVHKVLVDEIHTRYEELITIFDQDGFVVPLPEVDLNALRRGVRRVHEKFDRPDPQAGV